VTEQPLDRPNVLAGFEKMGGEPVPQGMWRDALGELTRDYGLLQRALDGTARDGATCVVTRAS
jgi:hypothetical protein